MASDIDLRRNARKIFGVALASVDAGNAVRRAVRVDGQLLTIQETTIDVGRLPRAIYVLAIGKAAVPMAVAIDEALGEFISAGLVVGTYIPELNWKLFTTSNRGTIRWQQFDASHPRPTQTSLDAAASAFRLLARANNENALVIFLVSGGGSSMIEWPLYDQLTLADLNTANRTLISCGASISEINSVRRAFSAVKGGRLAARAPNTDQITLIISDVKKGQESIVASGPTIAPPADAPDPEEVIGRYKLAHTLLPSIRPDNALTNKPIVINVHNRLRQHYVLLDCESALRAATIEACRLGFVAEFTNDISEQPIDEGCRLMLSRLLDLSTLKLTERRASCLISGGEFSCPVRGDGVGGRNAETVLRCAINIDEMRRGQDGLVDDFRILVLSAGTDGIDGNSPGAGAIASNDTIERARLIGLDPEEYLKRSDAFGFFELLDDVILTGPTGTNVRDLRITLASYSS